MTASLHGQEAISSARPAVSNAPQDHGITFPVSFSTEVFGNFTGGTRRTAISESLFRAGIKIDFEKAAGLKGFSLNLDGLYPFGTGLTSKAVHDFNTLSNIDAYDSPRLYEFWIQQEFVDGKFSIRLGQILADAEFFASDYGGLFLNSSFGAITLVSRNINPPIFPVPAPGLRLRAAPTQSFYAETAIFSGDSGDPATNNKHNTRFSFRSADGVLVFGEVGYHLHPKEERPTTSELSGTFKLGGFYDSRWFADKSGGGSHHGDIAAYFIVDQELWHPGNDANRALSFFTRIGGAPNDRNTVSFYTDFGLNFQGACTCRPQDILGLGFSHNQLSDHLVDDSGARLRSHREDVLELTYQAPFGEHVSLQPDLQFIFNPGATEPAPTAIVAGLRLSVKY